MHYNRSWLVYWLNILQFTSSVGLSRSQYCTSTFFMGERKNVEKHRFLFCAFLNNLKSFSVCSAGFFLLTLFYEYSRYQIQKKLLIQNWRKRACFSSLFISSAKYIWTSIYMYLWRKIAMEAVGKDERVYLAHVSLLWFCEFGNVYCLSCVFLFFFPHSFLIQEWRSIRFDIVLIISAFLSLYFHRCHIKVPVLVRVNGFGLKK